MFLGTYLVLSAMAAGVNGALEFRRSGVVSATVEPERAERAARHSGDISYLERRPDHRSWERLRNLLPAYHRLIACLFVGRKRNDRFRDGNRGKLPFAGHRS